MTKKLFTIVEIYEKSENKTFSYDRHMFFINTETLGIPFRMRPNWINVVREPMERFLSLYYYLTSSNDRMPSVVEVGNLEC